MNSIHDVTHSTLTQHRSFSKYRMSFCKYCYVSPCCVTIWDCPLFREQANEYAVEKGFGTRRKAINNSEQRQRKIKEAKMYRHANILTNLVIPQSKRRLYRQGILKGKYINICESLNERYSG